MQAGGASRRPFVVNWAPTDRTALETRAQEGVVVVAVSDESLEVLPRCRVEGVYRYAGASHASQIISIETKADLGAKFPFAGPVNLGAMLETHGRVGVEYHTIGEYKADLDEVRSEALQGDCKGASHVIASMSVGAYELFAGDRTGGHVDAAVPATVGASGGAERSYEHIDRGGDEAACEAATKKDVEPPHRCDSVLAIELLRVVRDVPLVAGEVWEGSYQCGGRRTESSMEITEVSDGQDVKARVRFEDGKVVGVFLARGRYVADSGDLSLEFTGWEQEPPGYVPVTPVGTVSVEGDVYRGAMREAACPSFEYRRRR